MDELFYAKQILLRAEKAKRYRKKSDAEAAVNGYLKIQKSNPTLSSVSSFHNYFYCDPAKNFETISEDGMTKIKIIIDELKAYISEKEKNIPKQTEKNNAEESHSSPTYNIKANGDVIIGNGNIKANNKETHTIETKEDSSELTKESIKVTRRGNLITVIGSIIAIFLALFSCNNETTTSSPASNYSDNANIGLEKKVE